MTINMTTDVRLIIISILFSLILLLYIIETFIIIKNAFKKNILGHIKYIIRISKKDYYIELIVSLIALFLVSFKLRQVILNLNKIKDISSTDQYVDITNIHTLKLTLILVISTLLYTIVIDIYKITMDIEVREKGLYTTKGIIQWDDINLINSDLKSIRINTKNKYLKNKKIKIVYGQEYLINKLKNEILI